MPVWSRDFKNGLKKGLGNAAIMQPPASRYRFLSVTWLLGSALLRLEDIDVTTAGNIERVTTFADQMTLVSYQRLVAVSNGTEEQLYSLLGQAQPLNI